MRADPRTIRDSERPRRRVLIAVSAILVVLSTLAELSVPSAAGGPTAPAHPGIAARLRASLAANAPQLFRAAAGEDELDGFEVTPLDPAMEPDRVLRSRPFIIGDNAALAFPARAAHSAAIDEEEGADRLLAFLRGRGGDRATIDDAIDRYGDQQVQEIVPDPALRAALLMLSGWHPYRATIAAVLDGDNPAGEPYAAVTFADLGFDGAIATLTEDPATGRHVLSIDRAYRREPPEALIPTIVHESLHGGGENSAEEELVATVLDTICWGEVLLVNPDIAHGGSDLTVFNNAKLVGLLNSSGRNGSGHVGIATSPVGDVFVGAGFEDLDAESIRAVVESDWFYGSLRHTGSEGQQTTAALIGRFPGGKALARAPRYDEEMLAVIDAGVRKILPPDDVVRLAVTLGLDITGGFSEGEPGGTVSTDPEETLSRRPFMPTDPTYFRNAAARKAPRLLDEEGGRAALASALADQAVAAASASPLLARYDDPDVRALIPDPSLRAATVLLGGLEPWSASFDAVFAGAGIGGTPLRVEFAPMRDSAPVVRGGGATPAVFVNSLLAGESPELLASVIVEGTVLPEQDTTTKAAIAAAVIGTVCWADLLAADPDIAASRTFGVLARNEYLLALLNTTSNRGGIGLLVDRDEITDILPGVYADATTFAGFVEAKPWCIRFDRRTALEAPRVFVSYLTFAGVEASVGADDVVSYGEATLENLDAAVAAFLPPERVYAVARALRLGTAAR